MRSETEIKDLVEKLERFNAAILQHAQNAGYGKVEDDDEVESADYASFNSNAQLLCALYWVMGQDTIVLKSPAPDPGLLSESTSPPAATSPDPQIVQKKKKVESDAG